MIATLTGKIHVKSPGHIIVQTGGIGFKVILPLSSYYALPDAGDDVFLLIHTHIREDAFTLFGFITPEEKESFEKLITISGIGPKLAINILSGISAWELGQAITDGNSRRVQAIPGVGKKTAERIILELKDKIGAVTGGMVERGAPEQKEPAVADAVSALVNLGYMETKAAAAVKKARQELDGTPQSIGELIKSSLKLLAG